MPQVVAYIGAYVMATVGVTGFVSFGTALVVGAAVLIGAGVMAFQAARMGANFGNRDSDKSRQSTVRGTIEPQKIIYGEALVSGPIVFVGVSGQGNQDMHHVIALAGHEVEDIGNIYLDNEIITNANLDVFGNVVSGTFGLVNGATMVNVARYLGTDSQAADSRLESIFPEYTEYHQGKGIAYIRTTFSLTENAQSQDLWDKYSPNNIKALVKGRKIYDPRLDVTPGASPTNPTYITWSDNPALCVADYLINTRFGMRVAPVKIDWAEVVIAANICDVVVSVPFSGTEKRYTANGVLYTTDTHKNSLARLLSSMNGNLIYSGGKYIIRAGAYVAPTESLDENDLTGDIVVRTSVERAERFNTVGGVFINPADGHKSAEFPKVTITSALLRDNSEVLEKELELSFTNTSYMAQRVAHKLIQMSDQQKVILFPANMAGLRVGVGDRVNLTIEEFGWSNKVFQCLGWSFTDNGGVTLTLHEDDASSYTDMDVSEYSTVSYTGVITPGFPGTPDPQNLTATGSINGIELNWTNPTNTSKFSSIIVYASPNSAWASAVEIGRGLATTFFHSAATTADPITSGATRYYWIRAVNNGGQLSDRNPDNDTSTIFATALTNAADSVEWVDVGDNSGLRPSNNATVGAQASIDLRNSTGVVLGDDDVLNSVVFEDITQVQLAGTGDILELVGGGAVDLQQLGDVAKYAYDADQVLNGYINGLNDSFGNLQDTLLDITAGVADVYVSDTAPVAGVGGVPDPIVIYSRWYDSDDSNKPYYWNGTAWIDLSDPRIASNQADITAVSASLNTTNTTVAGHTTSIGANASAISVLDSTVIALDSTVTTLAGSYDAFVASYEASDPIAGVAANSSAISAIDTRVTAAEGTISTSSTSITELTSDLTFYTKLEGTDGNVLQLVGGTDIDLQGTSAVGGATSAATNVLDSRVTSAEGTITSQASSITALSAAITSTNTNVSGNATAISGLTVIVESQGDLITASAADITALEVSLATESSTRASAVSALDVRVTENEGDITSQAGLITGLQSELDSSQLDIAANASATSALTTRVTTAEGTITAQGTSITTLTSNLATTNTNVTGNATAISGIDTRVTSAEGTITSQATAITDLTTTVGTNTASISTQATSINGIEANYGVKVDINGRVTGFGLNSTVATATPFSEFYIIADKFAVVDPASTASTPIIPFTVASGLITMGTNVRISGDLVTTGTISAERISIDGVTLDTDELGKLIVATGGIGTGQVATGAITGALIGTAAITSDKILDGTIAGTKFASNIRPVQVVGALPAGVLGDMAFLTTDYKLYRYGVSGWTAAIADFTAGSVDAAAIGAGAVTTAKIATDAVTSDLIASGAVIADSIASGAVVAGKIAALAVTLGTINSGAVTATEIATGAITAIKIDAGAVTADKIGANAITAVKIDASAITSDKIAAGAITAGKITAGAIVSADIAAGAIAAGNIAAGAIVAGKIAAGTITAADIAADTITAGNIAAGAIGASEIAAGAITAGKIAAGSIVAADIAAGTISADKILIDGITLDSDGSGNLIVADEGISTGKIFPRAVTVPTSSYVSGDFTIASIGDTGTVSTLSFTSSGAEVLINFSFRLRTASSQGFLATVVIWRDTTALLITTAGVAIGGTYGTNVALATLDSPTAGAHTYEVRVTYQQGTGQMFASNRSLTTLEVKK